MIFYAFDAIGGPGLVIIALILIAVPVFLLGLVTVVIFACIAHRKRIENPPEQEPDDPALTELLDRLDEKDGE